MSLTNNSSIKKPAAPGTTDSPYLGSKISLVSKAKIRYEGILYTIDANESTVALSKVRSFGTEDRPTDRPVPARDEIFEYIIFRGADIEDLQVREPPQSTLTQDPAIVESSMYPSNTRSPTVGTNNTSGNNQTRLSSNQGTMSSVQQGSNKGLKSSTNTDPLRQLNLNQQQSSRSFNQQSTSAQLDGQDYSYGNNQRRGRQQQDYYNDFSNNNNNNNRRGNQQYGYAEWPRTNNSAWENNNYRQQQNQRYPRQQQQQQQQQQNYEGNRFYPSKRTNNNQQGYNNYYGYRERRNSTGGISGNQQNQQRNNRQQRERTDSIRGNSNNRSTLKFIGDFDFEKSNAEFDKNAIEDELKKSLSIKTNKDKTSEASTTNNDNDKEKENDDQQQKQQQQQSPQQDQQTNSSTNQSEQQQQEPNPDGYYDKQKSFFDRISCETTEKEKTNSRRNWNEERRINAETFGLKYRPAQQSGNQRNGQGGYYNYNNRRNNNGQQSYYGNGARYQRGGGGGNYGDGQQRSRNTTYYNNTNKRMQAY